MSGISVMLPQNSDDRMNLFARGLHANGIELAFYFQLTVCEYF